MKKLYPILFILLLACEQKETVPEGVLPKPTMIELISKLHIGEALVLNRNLPQDSSLMHYQWYQDSIMKAYDTDTATFHRSFAFWVRDLKEMDELYSAVVDSLALRKAEVTNLIARDTVKTDEPTEVN